MFTIVSQGLLMQQKQNIIDLPRFIAICGNPKSGKSLAQELLEQNYSVQPVDDGFVLRQFAMMHMGATHDQVYTQEGKASLAYWPNGDPILDDRDGTHMNWRNVLGRLGKQLEDMFGEYVMPMLATAALPRDGNYSFGSVRKTQGGYFKGFGGVVIGLRNPDAKPTGNDFDVFDESLVDIWIENDGLSRGLNSTDAKADLAGKLHQALVDMSWAKAA